MLSNAVFRIRRLEQEASPWNGSPLSLARIVEVLRLMCEAANFLPALLLRLVRLAYRHIRLADDAEHEGSYSPDTRDNAERGRGAILNALLATTGSEGWSAKLEMAADPLFAHFRDRAFAIALERAAEEADGAAWAETDVVALDRYSESPPSTRDAMFAVMRDRLDDIDDLLLEDVSPREAWAGSPKSVL